MPESSMRKSIGLEFSILASLILVTSVAYFSPGAPEFVSKSNLLRFPEIFYLMVIGILLFYGLTGWRGVGKDVEMDMSLGFRESMDCMEDVLNVDLMRDFEFDSSSFGDRSTGGKAVVMDLGDEWLGLPIRNLKSVVDGVKGAMGGDGGFQIGSGCEGDYEKRNRVFGELSPLNLLERFNEASKMLRVNVDSGIGSCPFS